MWDIIGGFLLAVVAFGSFLLAAIICSAAGLEGKESFVKGLLMTGLLVGVAALLMDTAASRLLGRPSPLSWIIPYRWWVFAAPLAGLVVAGFYGAYGPNLT